jgi:hypothetical protein
MEMCLVVLISGPIASGKSALGRGVAGRQDEIAGSCCAVIDLDLVYGRRDGCLRGATLPRPCRKRRWCFGHMRPWRFKALQVIPQCSGKGFSPNAVTATSARRLRRFTVAFFADVSNPIAMNAAD